MTDSTGGQKHEVTAAATDAGVRLDRFLASRLPELSRSRIKALVESGHVGTGGAPLQDPARKVKPGQTFAIIIPELRPATPQAQVIALDIVYEDVDIIVINKSAGLVMHPAPGNEDMTLVNALIAHCGPSLSGIGGEQRPGIVHRIDKDTSGLVVVAKNDMAHRNLGAAFKAHDIERVYKAVVWGLPDPAAGEITGDIGRHPTHRRRMAIVRRGGRTALTRYRVLRAVGRAASLIECRLATGRTHQIRVHMAAIGHPIMGDPTYGGIAAGRLAGLGMQGQEAVKQLGRQALHAGVLGFRHPRTREPMRWEADLPRDINELITILDSI